MPILRYSAATVTVTFSHLSILIALVTAATKMTQFTHLVICRQSTAYPIYKLLSSHEMILMSLPATVLVISLIVTHLLRKARYSG